MSPNHRPWMDTMMRDRLKLLSQRISLLLTVLVAGFFCPGCGTGEYEARLSARIASLQSRAKASELQPPKDLPETQLTFRLPNVFAGPPLVEGEFDARRAKPVVITLPGLKFAYENMVQDAVGGSLPYYLFVGSVAGQSAQNVAAAIENDLKGVAQKESLSEWTNFEGRTVAGDVNQWRKIRFTGPQEFYYKNKDGQEQFLSMAGLLEIHLHEEAGAVVILAWRMPTSIEPNVDLAKWVPMVAGNVRAK